MNSIELDDDLKEYLSEFEHVFNFDDEICQACGIDFTSSVPHEDPFWTTLISFSKEVESLPIKKLFTENNIEYQVFFNIKKNKSELEQVINLHVKIFDLERCKKLLEIYKLSSS